MNEVTARIETIVIGPEAKRPLHEVPAVEAEAGRGLVGDRYHARRGSFNAPQFDPGVREVSLIASEAIAQCNARLKTALRPADFRRNIVTAGLDLSTLKGRCLRIGEVRLRVVRTAPPCRYLSRLLGEEMMKGLKGIGGVRAVIESGGVLRKGERIDVLP